MRARESFFMAGGSGTQREADPLLGPASLRILCLAKRLFVRIFSCVSLEKLGLDISRNWLIVSKLHSEGSAT